MLIWKGHKLIQQYTKRICATTRTQINQSIARIQQNLAKSSNDDQVQQFQIYGQGSSSDQPEQFTTSAERLVSLIVSQLMEESGLTSGIFAESRKKDMDEINKLVLKLQGMGDKNLNNFINR